MRLTFNHLLSLLLFLVLGNGCQTVSPPPSSGLHGMQGKHGLFAQAIAVSSDGKFVVSGGGDSQLIFWDAKTGRELKRFYEADPDHQVDGAITAVATSSDGRWVAAGVSGLGLKLMALVTAEELKAVTKNRDYFLVHPSGIYPNTYFLEFTAKMPDILKLAFGSASQVISIYTADEKITSYNVPEIFSEKLLFTHVPQPEHYHGELAASLERASERLFSLRRNLKEKNTGGIIATTESLIASAAQNGDVNVWDVRTTKIIQRIKNCGEVTALSISAHNDELLIANTKGEIRHVRLSHDEPANVFGFKEFLGNPVRSIALLPDQHHIAVACQDGSIYVVDFKTGITADSIHL